MVARVLFPVLTGRGNALTPPAPGDHKGPPFPTSSALAPTDHPASCLSSRLSLMPITADYRLSKINTDYETSLYAAMASFIIHIYF